MNPAKKKNPSPTKNSEILSRKNNVFNRSMAHWGVSNNWLCSFYASDMGSTRPVSSLCCLKICRTWHSNSQISWGLPWRTRRSFILSPLFSSVLLCQFLEAEWQNDKVILSAFLKGRRRRCRSKCLAKWALSFCWPAVLKNNKCFPTILRMTHFSICLLILRLKTVRMGIDSNRYWWIK